MKSYDLILFNTKLLKQHVNEKSFCRAALKPRFHCEKCDLPRAAGVSKTQRAL